MTEKSQSSHSGSNNFNPETETSFLIPPDSISNPDPLLDGPEPVRSSALTLPADFKIPESVVSSQPDPEEPTTQTLFKPIVEPPRELTNLEYSQFQPLISSLAVNEYLCLFGDVPVTST
ncbi:hypothetical protein Bca4012_029779 [Brassica carinata]